VDLGIAGDFLNQGTAVKFKCDIRIGNRPDFGLPKLHMELSGIRQFARSEFAEFAGQANGSDKIPDIDLSETVFYSQWISRRHDHFIVYGKLALIVTVLAPSAIVHLAYLRFKRDFIAALAVGNRDLVHHLLCFLICGSIYLNLYI